MHFEQIHYTIIHSNAWSVVSSAFGNSDDGGNEMGTRDGTRQPEQEKNDVAAAHKFQIGYISISIYIYKL